MPLPSGTHIQPLLWKDRTMLLPLWTAHVGPRGLSVLCGDTACMHRNY